MFHVKHQQKSIEFIWKYDKTLKDVSVQIIRLYKVASIIKNVPQTQKRYIDGNDFVPVRFGLKHSRTGNVVLYVVVDQNKIPLSSLTEIKKTEVVKTPAANADPEVSRSVTYSIAQIIEFVNRIENPPKR